MTRLPRLTTSPIVSPSRAPSFMSSSTTRTRYSDVSAWASLRTQGVPDPSGVALGDAPRPAGARRHGPREAPPVAVEHRLQPQEDRTLRQVCDERLVERVQVRAAVRVLNALRAPGRARGVVDRDRLLFVFEPALG